MFYESQSVTAQQELLQVIKICRKSIFSLLRLYEKLPNSSLIYYEDLIAFPKEVLQNCLAHLQEADEQLDFFMENFEEHKAKSYRYYNYIHQEQLPTSVAGPAVTDGTSNLYHSKNISKDVLKKLDTFFKAYDPYLYDKYLSRYQE